MSTTKEFAFDITLAAAIRVTAESHDAAVAMLRKALDAADSNLGAWPNGSPILAECSLRGVPSLFEIDGDDASQNALGAPYERLVNTLTASLSAWEDEEDSVKEEHAELIADIRTTLIAAGIEHP